MERGVERRGEEEFQRMMINIVAMNVIKEAMKGSFGN